MAQKELLLRDLSARLPHKVMVHIRYNTKEPCYGELTPKDIQWFIDSKIEEIKPYLRPMSSMTKDERYVYHSYCDYYYGKYFDTVESIDWLNKNMFAYRTIDGKDMFELGVALVAPEGMYNVKDK